MELRGAGARGGRLGMLRFSAEKLGIVIKPRASTGYTATAALFNARTVSSSSAVNVRKSFIPELKDAPTAGTVSKLMISGNPPDTQIRFFRPWTPAR